MRVLLLVFLALLLAAVMGLAVLAYRWWGGWGVFWAGVGLLAFGWIGVNVLSVVVQRWFLWPFRVKGAVLRGAAITIHGITPAQPPPEDEEDEDDDQESSYQDRFELEARARRRLAGGGEEATRREADEDDDEDEDEGEDEDEQKGKEGPLDWYYVDVTVIPPPAKGKFTHWEPGELALADPDGRAGDIDQTLGRVYGYQLWWHREWQVDESGKHEGPRRIRLHVGVPPGTRRARLRYYFETFGEIEFPSRHEEETA